MDIKLRKVSDIYLIDVRGEVDLYNAHKLKDVMNKMIAKKINKYVINLEQVGYIDSSGIGALISIYSELKKKEYHLRIAAVKGTVKKVIELTKLADFFPIVPDVVTAVKQLQVQK